MFDHKEALKRVWGTDDTDIASERNSPFHSPNEAKYWKDYVGADFSLPFYRPNLPSPLPTIEEAKAAILSDANLSRGLPCFATVVKIRDYAVKMAVNPRFVQEAENLWYLEKHCPDLKIPKLYAVTRHEPSSSGELTLYLIITEYIPGKSLYDYKKMPMETVHKVLKKLGEQVRILRSVPPPEPWYYGRINNQSWYVTTNNFLQNYSYKHDWTGPFRSHKEFATEIYNNGLAHITTMPRLNEQTIAYLEQYEEIMDRQTGSCLTPVLTHTDLQMHNIILREDPLNLDNPEICIIDWGEMAWLPAYFEEARTNSKTGPEGDMFRLWYCWELHHKDSKYACLDIAHFMSMFLFNTGIFG